MMMYIFIGLGVVVVGVVVFIFIKRSRTQDDDMGTDEIVPISDPTELDKIKGAYLNRLKFSEEEALKETPPVQASEPTPTPSVDPKILEEKEQLEQEKKALEDELAQSKKKMQEKEDAFNNEREELKAAFEQELSAKEKEPAVVSSDKLAALTEKLNHAEGSLMRLNGENTRLRRLVDEQKEMLGKFDKGFDVMATHNKSQKEQQSVTNEAMQEELARVNEEKEAQSQKDKAVADKLRIELEKLEKEKDQVVRLNRELEQNQKLVENSLKKEVKGEQLTEENVDLRQQLQKSEVQLQKIQESMEVMKMNYEQKLNEAQDEVYQLKNQSVTPVGEDGVQIDPAALLKTQLEGVSKEVDQLRSELTETQKSYKQLEDEKIQLAEKDRLTQFELTKNRAQAHGLEQICEELKKKVEMQAAAKEEE